MVRPGTPLVRGHKDKEMDTLQAFIHGFSNGGKGSGKGRHIIPVVNVLLQINKRNTTGQEASRTEECESTRGVREGIPEKMTGAETWCLVNSQLRI